MIDRDEAKPAKSSWRKWIAEFTKLCEDEGVFSMCALLSREGISLRESLADLERCLDMLDGIEYSAKLTGDPRLAQKWLRLQTAAVPLYHKLREYNRQRFENLK